MLVTQVSVLQEGRNISSGEAAFSYGQGDEATVEPKVTENDDLEDRTPGATVFRE